MEMKDIDLTKCTNCRFRAKVDGKEVVGKIEKPKTSILLTGGDMFGCVVSPTEMDNLLRGVDLTTLDGNFYITDFEIVPRDPERYQDWQVGDRARNPNEKWNDSAYKEIIFRSGELVICKDGNGDISGEKYKPQDGDVCYLWTLNGSFVFIFRNSGDAGSLYDHISFALDTNHLYVSPQTPLLTRMDNNTEFRPATEDEKQKLFDAMAKAGMLWNAEKKVVEDIPKPYEFKKGEPVLVRDRIENRWQLGAFCWINENDEGFPFVVGNGLVGGGFKYCLPYNERTMHLLGTTEDYKEE